ncbi:MAG: ABC transporter substrate-binding protein [Alicyclobacillus sp. RIFOXYA1_FULL_53_8]|nr:MAG: ABC transporter substrate-binding protein [Alicyclobacillus sp. RIFOXYA1_FULL_53_8]
MKKWKRAATGVMTLSVIGGLVAGCGTSGSTANSPASNGTGNSGSVPSGQTITLWSWQGGPELDAVKSIAQAWGKQHGDTVTVVDQSKNPNGFQFYATAARAGKGPDVMFGMPHDNNGLFQQEGLLSPVPQGLINPSDYTQSEIDAVTIQGQMYSLPVSVQTTALFYNTKDIPTPPTDWTSFVNDANKYGFGYDQANLYFDYAFVGGMGGYVFKNNNGTLDPTDIGLANSGSIQAFQLMRDMVSKYHWMTPSTTGAIAKAQFSAGKLGMYISGPWDVPDLKKAGVPYSIAPLPTLSNGQPATPFMGVITTYVNSHSKSQQGDWSLAQQLSNADAQTQYFKASQQLPTLVSLQQSADIQSDPYFKAFADQVKNATPMPNIPQMQAVWTAMSVIKNIIEGKVSPTAGANDFVNNIKKGIAVQGS